MKTLAKVGLVFMVCLGMSAIDSYGVTGDLAKVVNGVSFFCKSYNKKTIESNLCFVDDVSPAEHAFFMDHDVFSITITNNSPVSKLIRADDVFGDNNRELIAQVALEKVADDGDVRRLLYPFVPVNYVLLPGYQFMHVSAFEPENCLLCGAFELAPGQSQVVVAFVR